MRTIIRNIITGIFLISTVCSCSKDENTEPEANSGNPLPSLTVIFSAGNLGDMGYNDNLLAAAVKFEKNYRDSIDLHLVTPKTYEHGESAFNEWLENTENSYENRRILVLAGSEYEKLLEKTEFISDNGSSIILLESRKKEWEDGIAAINLQLYGVSYLAGRLMAANNKNEAVAILAMPDNWKLNEGLDGLTDGMNDGSPATAKIKTKFLSDNAEGFAMQDSAFTLASKIYKDNSKAFIYPLCGGSALGIYRFLDGKINPMVIGMDNDFGYMCYFMPFSVIRDVGKILYDYLEKWYKGESLPAYSSFGLSDGYTYIRNNTTKYQSVDWEKLGNEFINMAIEKEEAYEKNLR